MLLISIVTKWLYYPLLCQTQSAFSYLINNINSGRKPLRFPSNMYSRWIKGAYIPLVSVGKRNTHLDMTSILKSINPMNGKNELLLPSLQIPKNNESMMTRESVTIYLRELVNDIAKGQQCFVNLFGIVGTGRTYLLKKVIEPKCTDYGIVIMSFELDEQVGNDLAVHLAQHIIKQLSAQVGDAVIAKEVDKFTNDCAEANIEIGEKFGILVSTLLNHVLEKLGESNTKIAVFIDDLDLLTRTERKWFQQYIFEGLTEINGLGVFVSTQTPISPWRWQFRHKTRFVELKAFSLEETTELCDSNQKIAQLVQRYSGGHPATVTKLANLTKISTSHIVNEDQGSILLDNEIKSKFLEILHESIKHNLSRVDPRLRKYFYYIAVAVTFDPNLLRAIATSFDFADSDSVTDFTDLAWDMSSTGLVEWKSINGRFNGYYLAENLRYRLVFFSQQHSNELSRYVEILKLLVAKYKERAEREFEWSEAFAFYIYYTGLLAKFEPQDPALEIPVVLHKSIQQWLEDEGIESERKNASAIKQALELLPAFRKDFREAAIALLRQLKRIGAEQLEENSG